MTGRLARHAVAAAICATILSISGSAQTTPRQPLPAPQTALRIEAAVALALANYPAIHAAEAQLDATKAGVDLARTAYLPRTDLLWQQNRATRNNVAGLLLPQGVVPSISGPVAATTYDGLWGSAAGALLSWEPFDFGLRRASVGVAESLVTQAAAGLEMTRLQVAVRAADAFLAALAADEVVRAAQANVDRLQVLATSVSTLVQNQLRPGADASRADAEVAVARVQQLRARLVATAAHATLAESVGLAGQTVTPDPGSLLVNLPTAPAGPVVVETHPLARVEAAAIATIHERGDALGRAYVPRVNLQSALFARGAPAAGLSGPGAAGLWPKTANWAVGVTVTFSLFDVAGLNARRRVEAGNERAERARYDQTLQALRAQDVRASSALDIARQILAAIPAELQAARDAERRARARYEAGLAPITEVADAARLLAQAETDDALSRLGMWQALLAEASARGTLALFLDQVK
jgi:outer membrane protein TolC